MTTKTIAFTRGVPAPESYPLEKVAEAASYAVRHYGEQLMPYTKNFGLMPLKEVLAEQYGVTPQQVLLSNGSLQILDFAGHVFLGEGTTAFTELPTYDRTLTLFRRHKANIVGIPLEKDGPNMDALEAALEKHQPKFFYVIPDFQNPSGATASLEKRQQLVAIARKHNLLLLEDSPYRPLRYRGEQLPSLFELGPDCTMQMSSYTKQISPGIRVGYIVGNADIVAKIAKVAEDTYITPNLMGQGIVHEFIQRGWLETQLGELKALYGPRLEAITSALQTYLPDAEWIEPDGGFFLSVTLPEGITNEALRARASELGLILSNGRGFFINPADGDRFVRLPFCALSEADITEGVKRLAEAVNSL